MKKHAFVFCVMLFIFGIQNVLAQRSGEVSGVVTDTSKTAISSANISLITGKDTLRTTSNGLGYFGFSKVKTDTFTLKITVMGYQSYTSTYSFGKEKSIDMPDIRLKLAGNMLKEVVIKSKPNPIRIMQDTVEYNAASYTVLEGDRVSDLLKQLPGMEVDDEDNVKTMGKEMTKIRVNGKDFFTNNVKDFISKLPAEIVSKIQVIDDFGDEANFTGLKVGEPAKMLNIVTKPGMNKGKFGAINAKGGTNDQIGANGDLNLWNESKQRSGSLKYGRQYNGAGIGENYTASANYRDKMGESGSMGFNYNFTGNGADYTNTSSAETINKINDEVSTLYSNNQSKGNSNNNSQYLNWDVGFQSKKVFINGTVGLSYHKNSNVGSSINNQTGYIRQDLRNSTSSTMDAPSANLSFNFSKRLSNKKNSFSGSVNMNVSNSRSNQNISTNTLYYDNLTGVLEKDSVLSRNIVNQNAEKSIVVGFNYSVGLKKPKDTLASQNLNFGYNTSFRFGNTDALTSVYNNKTNVLSYVDSLSTISNSMFINQTISTSYNYNNKKMRYNLGFNARPTLLYSNYTNLNQKVSNFNLNYAPNINVSKQFAKSKTLSVTYSGNNQAPNIFQLQPVRNTQNLQNIVIGNPNLKPSFNHNLSSSFNYVLIKSGASAQSSINFSSIQNEIVSNVILVPDTLSSLKRETRFENTNGSYNFSGYYSLNLPFNKNKFTLGYSGNLGYGSRATFIDNEKSFINGFNIAQRLTSALNLKKLSANASASYSSRLTNYSLTQSDSRNIQSWNFGVSGRATLLKTYKVGFNASKVVNVGYALGNNNSLLINANMNKVFFKNRALTANVTANDLLNQGNNLSRNVIGNSIIDSRSNQITRYFTFGLTYNLSKFGSSVTNVETNYN